MSIAFFIYTLSLLVICVLAASVCLSAFLVSHRRRFMLAVVMFFCYLLDIASIFQEEFLSQNTSFDAAMYYHIYYPFLKIVVSAGFLLCLWLIVCDFLNERRSLLVAFPLVVYACACIAIVLTMPEGPWQQFLYYTMRQAFLFWMAGYTLFRWFSEADEIERTRMRRFRTGFIVFCAISVLIVIEDAIVILMIPPGVIPADFPLYLSERNFSENLMLLLLAWLATRAASDTLALRFEQPPQNDEQPLRSHINELLPAYCKQHGLTPREGEVLRLILMGKDNQNIASDLTLALGTVKAHVHNILKKTGQPDREHLKRQFWSE